MSKGFSSIRQAANEVSSKRGQSSGPGALYFRLQDGESTNVRFLEQDEDITWCWMHELPPEQGRSFGRQVPCLDQENTGVPCPGCERDLRRVFKGFINLIWEDAPVFQRDADNRIIRDSSNGFGVQGRGFIGVKYFGGGVFKAREIFDELRPAQALDAGKEFWQLRAKRVQSETSRRLPLRI